MNFFNNTLPNIKPLLYGRITDNFHILGENKEEKKAKDKRSDCCYINNYYKNSDNNLLENTTPHTLKGITRNIMPNK